MKHLKLLAPVINENQLADNIVNFETPAPEQVPKILNHLIKSGCGRTNKKEKEKAIQLLVSLFYY